MVQAVGLGLPPDRMGGMALGHFDAGVLGAGLLRAWPWGLNFLLWVSALVAFILWLGRGKMELWGRGGFWLLLPSLLFAADFIWRESEPLYALDLFALWVTASLAVFRA